MKKLYKSFIILILFVFIFQTVSIQPVFGLSVKEEEELSQEFLKVVLQRFEFIQDPLILGYVKKIGHRIEKVIPPQPFRFNFYVIKEPVYNAFAGPAGHIFVTQGIFEAMDSEAELAGILSHEMAHITCRHISRRLERSSKIGLATLAGVIAGVFLGIGGAGQAASALTVSSMAAGQSLALSYSREDELQADQIGLEYLTQAGYSASGLITMLKKIRSKQWFGPKEIPTYLSTHPAIEERMVYIDTWMDTHSADTAASSSTPSEFLKVHSKLLAQYGNEQAVLKEFEEKVAKNPDDAIANYGYGLVLAKIGDRKKAISHLETALEDNAFDPYLLTDMGRVYFEDGQFEKAFKILEGAASIAPEMPETLLYLGRTQLARTEYTAAAESFEKMIKIDPDYDPQAYYFLGESYGKQGNMEKGHYYLGLYFREKREFQNAVFHMKRAQELKKGDSSEIDKILEETIKQEKEARKRIQENENQ